MIAPNNGNSALSKRTTKVEEEPPADGLMQLPPWLQSLRDAMGTSIEADDLKEIMQAQVKRAKEGDMKSVHFVMNQAHKMLQAEQKRVTIIQNNYYDTPTGKRPDSPLEPSDDRARQLSKLTARAAAGEPLTGHPKDRRTQPISDQDEKELRRREQAAEDEA